MESMKKVIKHLAGAEKGETNEELELDYRFENWDIPINCSALTEHPEYHDKDIPVDATSYDLVRKNRFFKRIKLRVQGEVKKRIVNPIFRRETLSGHVWKNDVESKAAFIALAFSAGTLFRFPYVCLKYGGGVFILMYSLLILFVMQPLVFMSVVFGRLSGQKLEKYPVFHATCKGAGIQLVYIYMGLVILAHQNIVVGYSGVYVLSQILETSPGVCTPRMRKYSPNCVPYNRINPAVTKVTANVTFSLQAPLSTELFFRLYVQGDRVKHGPMMVFPGREWRYFIGFSLALLVLIIVTSRHVVSNFSRVLIYGTFLVPVLLIGLLASQLAWSGALRGIFKHFFDFKWPTLGSIDFWIEVWSMAFSSCIPGYGVLTFAAKYKSSVKGLYTFSWLFSLAALTQALLAYALVTSELGILEHISHIQSYYDVVHEKAAIGFICLSNVLLRIPTVIASVAVFSYVGFFGLWAQVVTMDACIGFSFSLIQHLFPKKNITSGRIYFTGLFSIVNILLTSVYALREGPYVFKAHYLFSLSWVASIVCLVQVYAATRLYGMRLFFIKVELLLKKVPPRFFITEMRFLMLPVLIGGSIPMTIYLFSFGTVSLISHVEAMLAHEVRLYGSILNVLPVTVLCIIIAKSHKFKKKKKLRVVPLSAIQTSRRMHTMLPPSVKVDRNSEFGEKEGRFFTRRKSVVTLIDEPQVHFYDVVEQALYKMDEEEARENFEIQFEQKKDLEKLLQRKLDGLALNKLSIKTVSPATLDRFPMAESYFKRFTAQEIAFKDIQYLSKLLQNYDITSAFVSAQLSVQNDLERPCKLIQSMLLGQTDAEEMLQTEPDPHREIISKLVQRPIGESALRKIYADHILQELGAPYESYCDWDLLRTLAYENVQAVEPQWLLEPIYDEYVIRYPLSDTGKQGQFHVLVIESIRHALLDRLPQFSPKIFKLNKEVLTPLSRDEEMHFICSRIPPEILHGDLDSGQIETKRVTNYTRKIRSRPFTRRFDFLKPDQVCIVVLITTDDEEMLDLLEHTWTHPLNKTAGYLEKPGLRRSKAKKHLQLIQDYFNGNAYPSEVDLITYTQVCAREELRQYGSKLADTASEILYHDLEEDDEDGLPSRSSLKTFSSFEDDSGLRINLQRRRFQIAESQENASSMEHKQSYDKYYDFIGGLDTWTNVPPRVSLRKMSQFKGMSKRRSTLAPYTVQFQPKGRRVLSRANLGTNFDSLRVRLFPMGSDPMKTISDGPGPDDKISVRASRLSLQSTSDSAGVESDSNDFSEGSGGSSEGWTGYTQKYGHRRSTLNRKSVVDDINDDRRYAYITFRKAKTKGKVLEIQRKGGETDGTILRQRQDTSKSSDLLKD